MSTTPTQPGAEMDAQVARMMGWTDLQHVASYAYIEGAAAPLYGRKPTGRINANLEAVPRFSTTWNGAGLVVEHMLKTGWSYAIWDVVSVSSVQPAPACAFARSVYPPGPNDPQGGVMALGVTAPAAICAAALLVLSALSDAGDGSSGALDARKVGSGEMPD